MEDLVKITDTDGKIFFHRMSNSQICEHILIHVEDRKTCKAFNNGEVSVIVEGFTYKIINKESNK